MHERTTLIHREVGGSLMPGIGFETQEQAILDRIRRDDDMYRRRGRSAEYIGRTVSACCALAWIGIVVAALIGSPA